MRKIKIHFTALDKTVRYKSPRQIPIIAPENCFAVLNEQFAKMFQQYKYNDSGLGCLFTFLLLALLLGSIGLGWLVNGFLILLALVILTPIIAWFGFSWWLKRNLIEDQCPVCNYQFTGFNNSECRCPNCGEALKVEAGKFQRLTPPGTIDVQAVEVSVQQIED